MAVHPIMLTSSSDQVIYITGPLQFAHYHKWHWFWYSEMSLSWQQFQCFLYFFVGKEARAAKSVYLVATGCMTKTRNPAGAEIFVIATTGSRPAPGSIKPPIQWAPRAPFRRIKRPGREADHLHILRFRKSAATLPVSHRPSWCVAYGRLSFTINLL